jgi:hypothetical protein
MLASPQELSLLLDPLVPDSLQHNTRVGNRPALLPLPLPLTTLADPLKYPLNISAPSRHRCRNPRSRISLRLRLLPALQHPDLHPLLLLTCEGSAAEILRWECGHESIELS